MEQYKERIHQWLFENRLRGTRLLKRLVQEASVQGSEKYAQALVIEKLRQLGLKIDIWTPDIRQLQKHGAFVSTRTSFEDSPNVVGILKGKGGGRSIILNGHIDVVPEGDETRWTYEPYSAYVKDGKLYGRGSTDMKGGNVALLFALEAIISLNISLKGDVIFQSVIEKESGGAGTLACVLRGYKADAAIIPEPTNMKILPEQQGSMWFRIKVKGRSAHGGMRYEGVNAIEKANVVINHLLELGAERNGRIQDSMYEQIPLPLPINIGKISGGTWPSSVPDTVILEGRMGVAPNEMMSDARNEMKEWLARLKEKDGWFTEHPVGLEWFGARWLPGQIDPDHELVKILTSQYRFVKAEDPKIEASPWETDGGILTNIGDIPTIVFGPGIAEAAHFPNEYIELNAVFEAAEIIALTVIQWCGIANE
ncbi:peptidase [Bacillus songklensis]|uniref:Peptidase n=1 Tax=Bacillus songklensis TaxID=1069116 RepID=A0ABV8B4L6_9BACI